MKKITVCIITSFLLTSCGSVKQVAKTPTEPPEKKVPAKFDFSPPSRAQVGSTGITIAMVKPSYIGTNPEYFVSPFNEMAERMASDFDELLTAKGFTIRGPYGSRDEMTFNDKVNTNFILEIGIALKPTGNDRKYYTTTHQPTFGEILVNKNAPTTYTYKMSGEITLGGDLVIKAKSSQYGELLWQKSIALDASSFTYAGSLSWNTIPTYADELKQDVMAYNPLARELEKYYSKSLALAWQQIDPAEMKTVAEQGKKADKKSN